MKFKLDRKQSSKISREKIIQELLKIAKLHDYTDFKQVDFDSSADFNHYTVYREFGSWKKTMDFLKKHLAKEGIDFKIISRRSLYTEQEMFDEMERIWRELGHRPSRNEWVSSNPSISYDSLYRKFGSWTKACLKFIEYKSGGETVSDTDSQKSSTATKETKKVSPKLSKDKKVANSRTISLKVRIKVLSRDNFKCIFCGKSPATDLGTKLHIDHITPFSKGGSNKEENLQTLCEECNLGKSNDIL